MLLPLSESLSQSVIPVFHLIVIEFPEQDQFPLSPLLEVKPPPGPIEIVFPKCHFHCPVILARQDDPRLLSSPDSLLRTLCLRGLALDSSPACSPEIDFSVFPMEPPVLPLCATADGADQTAHRTMEAMSALFKAHLLPYFETNFSWPFAQTPASASQTAPFLLHSSSAARLALFMPSRATSDQRFSE